MIMGTILGALEAEPLSQKKPSTFGNLAIFHCPCKDFSCWNFSLGANMVIWDSFICCPNLPLLDGFNEDIIIYPLLSHFAEAELSLNQLYIRMSGVKC